MGTLGSCFTGVTVLTSERETCRSCVCVCAANRRADSTDMQIIVRETELEMERRGRMKQKRRKEASLLLPIVSLDLPHL